MTWNVFQTIAVCEYAGQKQVLVYASGQPVDTAQPVSGTTLEQILLNATERLRLSKPARHLFTVHGKPVRRPYTEIRYAESDRLLEIKTKKRKF